MGFHSKLRGLDLHAPTNEQVENQTGSTIDKLKVVSLDGMGATHPKVILANPNVTANFGITSDSIQDNVFGLVTTLGFLWAVDTSAWAVDTTLYSTITGDLSSTPLGIPVATVIEQDVNCGVLYVFALSDLIFDSVTNDWHVVGNTGTDEDVNWIGTTDAEGFQTKTNNTNRMFIDAQGRTAFGAHKPDGFVHIKEHTACPGTGRLIHTFNVSTSNTSYNAAFSFIVPDTGVAKIRAHITGRESSTSRCSLERVNTYVRDGGSAIRVHPIGQSTYTYKSHSGYNFRWAQSGNMAILEVKADTANLTKWIGTIEIDLLIDT